MPRSRPPMYLLVPLIATLGVIAVAVGRDWRQSAAAHARAEQSQSVPLESIWSAPPASR